MLFVFRQRLNYESTEQIDATFEVGSNFETYIVAPGRFARKSRDKEERKHPRDVQEGALR